MRQVIVFVLLSLMIILTGCQDQNRYLTHRPEIIEYQGDREVLLNCCHAAMSLLADDIKQNEGLDSSPLIKEETNGWSGKGGKEIGQHLILSCNVDEREYRIEMVAINDKPAIVTIKSPTNDYALVNHLVKLFSNFNVKQVSTI